VQVTAIAGLLGMVLQNPIHNLYGFIVCGLLVTISTASQHILLLAYQMETLHSRNWGVGEGISVFAYRMALITGGSVALSLATVFSWQEIYIIIAILMFIGLLAVLIMGEPEYSSSRQPVSLLKKSEWLNYVFINSFKDFMTQKGWIAILIFMLIYRLPERLLSMMQTLFLLDLGFTYIEISIVAKTFGMVTSICGGIVGGYWIRCYGYKKTLFWGALAHAVACLIFLVQEKLGANLPFLYITIGLEHFFSGVMLTGFFSYQLVCASLTFAATQLALLTSFSNLSGVFAKPIAGIVIDNLGWVPYLWLVVLSAIPGILWVYRIPFSRRQ
jgi:MFS transporter, PAT family, beta-lactamase induction signal transducer AmpG